MINERDPNLYFSTRGPFVVHAPQPVSCDLGQIVYAGTKWDSRATYAHAPAPTFMRPTPHFLLVLTLEGEADYVDSTGLQTTLRAGTLVWAAPGVNQSYGPRKGSRWSELFLWFSGPIFETWQKQGFPGERSRLCSLAPTDYWVKRLRDIVQPPAGTPDESPVARLCRFQQFLADALPFEDSRARTHESMVWKEKASVLLKRGNLIDPLLEDVAAELNMSYTTFRKRFQQLTGKSPGQFRSEEIIRRACTRLLQSGDSLTEIATALGFHDAFHFSRRFKQLVGMAPKDFRRQHSVRQKRERKSTEKKR